ncbi:hypothetical protein GCM10010392_16700 [Streptomyces clavifer]|nr:hypothetical protein GCM10010392_16700 [Streptomyces clavifer]
MLGKFRKSGEFAHAVLPDRAGVPALCRRTGDGSHAALSHGMADGDGLRCGGSRRARPQYVRRPSAGARTGAGCPVPGPGPRAE